MAQGEGESPVTPAELGEHSAPAPVTSAAVLQSAEYVLLTHPGKVRPLNEDAIGAEPRIGLFILADGLGGYNAGEIASTMAVSSLLSDLARAFDESRDAGEVFDAARVLRDTLVVMNANIFRAALNSTAFEGMATTVVVAWLIEDTLWVAHTGDSRLYRYRRGQLEQLTRDHSFSQELLDAGMVTEEEARTLPAKNLVTRALGASPDIEPEVNPYDAEPGDVLLLCSDGLTEMVTHYEIDGLLSLHASGLSTVAERMIHMANEAGGRDNVSVVLLRIPTPPLPSVSVGGTGLPAEHPTLPFADDFSSMATAIEGDALNSSVVVPVIASSDPVTAQSDSLATPDAAGRIERLPNAP